MWQNNDSLNTVWSKRALNTSLDFVSSAYSSKHSKSSELSFFKSIENESSKVFVCCFYRKHFESQLAWSAKLYLFRNCEKHLISSYYTKVKEKLLQLIWKNEHCYYTNLLNWSTQDFNSISTFSIKKKRDWPLQYHF